MTNFNGKISLSLFIAIAIDFFDIAILDYFFVK